MKKITFTLISLTSLLLFSCNQNNSSLPSIAPNPSATEKATENVPSVSNSTSKHEKVLPTSITASEETISLKVGETIQFSYQILPENCTETAVKYTYDETYISVDKENKTITGKTAGSTNLIISTTNNKKAIIAIKVTNAETIQIDSISTTFSRSVLAIGEEIQLSITSSPVISGLKFKYSTTKPSVATISDSGVLKGVSVGSCQIKISVENSDVTPITLSISVSLDTEKIKLDKINARIKEASFSESTDIVSGTIARTSKSNSSIKNSNVSYHIYDDHIYDDIEAFDGSKKTVYYGLLDNSLYTLVRSEGKTISSDCNIIGENSFRGEISESKAKSFVSLPAFYSSYYSSVYSYGVGTFIADTLNSYFYNSTTYTLTETDNTITFSSKQKDYSSATSLTLELTFDGTNFSKATFSKYIYNDTDVDESFNIKDGVEAKSYETFAASLVSGKRQKETNPKVDSSKFYFSDFALSFYVSTDTEKAEPKTEFTRGDTIIFKPTSCSPEGAYQNFDRIQIVSSSNTDVIDIAPNKMALNAVGAGKSTIVVKSKKVTKQYELSVNIAKPTAIKFSSLDDCITCEDETKFYLNREPYGADDNVTVSLAPGDENYATITTSEISGIKYYHLKGNKDRTDKEHTVTIKATSNVDSSIHAEVKVKIIKPLTSSEALNILLNSTYKAGANKDFHNYSVELNFTDDSNAILKIFKHDGTVYDSCNFIYALNKGKFSIAGSSSTRFTNGYAEDLTVNIASPDYEKIDVSFAEEDEEEGKLSVTYHLTREDKAQ